MSDLSHNPTLQGQAWPNTLGLESLVFESWVFVHRWTPAAIQPPLPSSLHSFSHSFIQSLGNLILHTLPPIYPFNQPLLGAQPWLDFAENPEMSQTWVLPMVSF